MKATLDLRVTDGDTETYVAFVGDAEQLISEDAFRTVIVGRCADASVSHPVEERPPNPDAWKGQYRITIERLT